MKRVFKRWMAMLLAVLMVMGTLPTTAWAARIEDDAVPAIPVVDEKDGVVDTLAKSGKDDDVTPINPVDPDPQPGKLNPVEIGTVETPSGTITLGGKDVIATGKAPELSSTNVEGIFAIAVLPWFSTDPLPPAASDYVDTYNGDGFNSAFPNNNDIFSSAITDETYVGPSFIVRTTSGLVDVSKLDSIELLADGTVRVNGVDYTAVQKAGDALDANKVIAWASEKTTLYHGDGQTAFNPAELGYLPYKVLIGGTSGYAVGDLKIPLVTNPLKVKIETKDATMKRLFDYTGTNNLTPVGTVWLGDHLFTEVTLTNTTDAEMTVSVTIARGELTNSDTGYGTNTSFTDASDSNVRTRLKTDLGYTITETKDSVTIVTQRRNSTVNENTVLGNIYGLVDTWTTGDSDTIAAGTNGPTQTTLSSITIPANGSKTIYVAGTAASDKGDMILSRGFYIGTSTDVLYSTYKITAEVTSAEYTGVTADDMAGIRWASNPVTWPKVRLIHGTDKSTNIKPGDDTGNIIDGQDSLAPDSTGSKPHIVKSKNTVLEWNSDPDKQYYELKAGTTEATNGVPIGDRIYVDGVRTDAVTLTDASEIIYISMGTVDVTAVPPEKADDILGHYMWDTTATTDWKKVTYSYYPYGATVGVYAKKEGFTKWTGASYVGNITDGTGVMTEPDNNLPTEANSGGNTLTKVAAAQVKVNSDITAIANYLTPITLVTTFDGKDLGDNTVVNPGDRSTEYVFSIVVTRTVGGGEVARYSADGGSGEVLDHITKQEGGGAWEIEGLDASTSYTLTINNKQIGTFTGSKAKDAETGYHFVVELVGVKPIVVDGSNNAANTLSLPDDLNPNRTVKTVTGAAKNTDGAVTFYYPKDSNVAVNGKFNSGSEVSRLTYPNDTADANMKPVTHNATDQSWRVTASNGNVKLDQSGNQNFLTATFGATNGAASVKVLKDGTEYTGLKVQLSKNSSAPDDANDIALTYDGTKKAYYKDTVSPDTYTIWVTRGSGSTAQSVAAGTLKVDAGDTAEEEVKFWTVSVNVSAATKGHATMTVDNAGKIINGEQSHETDDTYSIVVLDGTKVTWTAGAAVDHYRWLNWDGNNAWGINQAPTELNGVAIEQATTKAHTANFEKKTYNVTFKPNGGNNLDGANADKVVTVTAESTTGAATPTATRTGYTFVKWLDQDGKEFTSATQVLKDMTVEAQWTVKKYNVNWNANGGWWGTNTTDTVKTQADQPYGTTISSPYSPAPNRTDYTLEGWYTEPACTNKIDFDNAPPTVPDGNVTYYANWTRNTCDVTVIIQKNNTPWADFPTTTEVVIGTNASTPYGGMRGPTTNGTVKFEGVEWDSANEYTVFVGGVDVSSGDVAKVKVNAATREVVVNYYELTVETTAKNDTGANVGAIAQSTSAISSTTYTDTSTTVAYLKNTVVNIATREIDNRYNFNGWTPATDTTLGNASSTSTTVKVDKEKTVTAGFSKEFFNATLDLTLNGDPVAAFDSNNITGITVEKATGNKAFTTRTLTVADNYNTTTKKWEAKNLPSGNTYNWKVATVSGTFTVTTLNGDPDPDEQELALYSIKVVNGEGGNDTTHKPTVDGAERVIMKRNGSKTLAANPKPGYECTGWVNNAGGNLPNGASTPDTTTVTLSDTYAGTAELVLKPTYTFNATIKTQYNGGDENPGGSVVLKSSEGEKPLTASSKGNYSVTGLTPNVTYTVWVNGFDTATSFNAPGTQTVTLVMLTGKGYDDSAPGDGGGSVSLKIGTDGPSGASVYVPSGATTDGGKGLSITATATNSTNYRLRDAGTYTADTETWTRTESAVDWTAGTAATQTFKLNNLTKQSTDITAHFVRQYAATVSVDPTSGGTATFRAKPANTGTVINDPATTATVDAGDYVKAKYESSVGNTLKNWTFERGTLWTTADKSAGSELTNGTDTTETEVYFFPTGDNATLTAHTKQATYDVEVTVNLDNGEVKDGYNVWLRPTSPTTGSDIKLSYDTNKHWTAKVLPGKYTVVTDVTGKTEAATAAVIEFEAKHAEPANADYTPGKLKAEVNYYTINLVTDVTKGVANSGNKVKFQNGITSATTANTSVKRVVLATTAGGNIDGSVIATPVTYSETHGDDHYRFEGWTASIGTVGTGATASYSLPALTDLQAKTGDNFNIDKDHQITLTATFVQQYRVEVGNASTAPSNRFTPSLKKDGDSSWAAKKFILVDVGDSVIINGAAGDGSRESGVYVLSEWTLDDDTMGTFDNSTHTNATKPANGPVGYVLQNGKYAPAKDSILYLNAWQTETPTAGWVFDKGTGTATSPKEDTGRARRTTWTNADGQAPSEVRIENAAGNTSLTNPLVITAPANYTNTGTNNEYYTILAKYLKDNVPIGTYTLNFDYVLGPKDHPNNVNKTAVSTNFIVSSNTYKLTQALVWAKKDDPTATANPTASSGRNSVFYRSHTVAAPDIDYDDLEFTWYYADEAPAKANTNFNAETDPKTAANTEALKAAGVQVLGSTVGTNGVGAWSEGTNTIDTGAVAVTPAMKGKYIFAVVNVKGTVDTAEGAVITNAIQVDYDAKITVKEDGDAVDNTEKDGYAVYLWPTTGGTFDKSAAITAKYNGASQKFETENAALNAKTSYNVYVREVESNDTAAYIMLTGTNNVVSVAKQESAEANYYTVTLEAVTANRVTHAKDNSSPQKEVGETFTSYPDFNAATGKGTPIPTGKAVLAGSTVTAKAKDLGLSGDDAGKGWTQDYDLTWMNKATSGGNYAPVPNGATKVQTNKTAVSTGHTHTTNLAGTLYISGGLEQKTYEVKGIVKATGGGKAVNPKLTVVNGENTYTFNGSFDANNGGNNSVVTFNVPLSNRTGAINTVYTLSAEPAANSTLKGYCVPAGTTSTTPDPIPLQPVTAAGSDKFTIFIEATVLSVLLNDEEGTNKHSVGPVSATDKTYRPAEAHVVRDREGIQVVYNYNAITKTVTVTNKGNTPLTLTPVIERKTKTDTGFVKITSLTAGADDKGVTFAYKTGDVKLTLTDDDAFTLDLDESREITITIPDTLTTYDNMSYHLDFTSVDGRKDIDTKGPTVGYELKIDIDPVTVGRVTATEQGDGSFKVENNWIKEDVKKPISDIVSGDYTTDKAGENLGNTSSWAQLKTPQDDPGNAVASDNDIQYSWYVADWDAVVTLGANGNPTATGGTIKAGQGTVSADTLTYMPKPEERGMALYLIAKGVNNAQGAAMTPNRTFDEEPIPVPFAGYVRVYEDGAQVSSQTAAGNYKVYLRDVADGETGALIPTTPVADTANTGKWIHKTADTALLPGHTYEVLVSAAEGDGDDHRTKVTGETVTVGDRYAQADYYLVTVNPTTLSQGKTRYDTVLGKYDDSELFFKTVPQAKPTAVGDLTGKDVTGKHVLKGTKVTFTYDHWDLDYNLYWTDGVSATDTAAAIRATATTNAVQTLTYDQTRAAVNTKLVLNLYEVKAYVDGTVGSVSEVTMALTDGAETFTFYAKAADAGDTTTHQVCGLDTPLAAAANIEMFQSVSFWLPATKGDNGYNVTGTSSSTNYKLEGYRATHNPGGATTGTLNKTVTANTSLDVVLAGSGSALTVADNVSSATSTPPLATNNRETVQGTASISGTTKSEPTVTQTIELNYHYNATQTIQLTISNTSKDEDGNPGASLATVTANFGTAPSWLTIKNNGLATAQTNVPSSGNGSSFTVDLEIADNLDVAGTYTYSPSFTFTNEEGTSATVTYTLKVIVNPLPITSLTIKDNAGALQLTDYDDTAKTGGVWVDHDNDNATDPVSMSKVSFDTGDVKYVWVEAPLGRTVTKSDLNMTEDAGGNTITATATALSAGVTVLDTQTNTSYTPAKQGVNYQLVAYRASSTSNAKDFAVSNAVTTTYDGIVYVNVDGARKGVTNNAPNPGYKVEFYDGATKVTDGEWKSVATNTYAYVSKDGLTPGKDYTVKVSRTTTDVEATVAEALAKKLAGTDIGTALTNSNVTEVSYFTVHADNFVPEHYKPGITGETLPTIAPKIWLDTLDVTNKTVLSGQSVTAKVETAWTQDYDLTWRQDGADQGAAVTAGDAVANGYTPANDITAETHIGGRLVQNTYDVLGNIQNLTNHSGGSVKKVELTFKADTGDTRSFVLTTDAADSATNHIHDNNSVVNDNSDTVTGNVGDHITVRVVKGAYDIVAFDGLNTTIQSVRIGGGNDPVVTTEVDLDKTRNKETLTKVEGKDREFTVYVAARDMRLGVTDNETPTANAALSIGVTGNDANQHADNAEVHYFNATSGTFDLTLSNPGNTDLKVTAKVFRFAPTDTIPDYATGTWTGGETIAADRSYTDTDVLKITNIWKDNDPVEVGDTARPAGTVTLDIKADNADDAIYVVRFTSTYTDTNGTDNGPTVYYVLNLRVDPLPIVEVSAEDPKTDGTLRLKNNALDSVKVSPDGDTADTTKFVEAATTAKLDDIDDISFVWAVSERDDLTKDDFALNPTTNKITSAVADVDDANSKTRKPDGPEQGKYFYLIAYRKDANSNADDFAVSAALYAQVTISLKTQRYSDKSPVSDASVQITGTYGTGETATRAKSNNETLVVPVVNGTIAFTADLTDVTHKDTTNTPPVDAPNTAEYYFVGWGPEGDDRVAVDGKDRLSMTYTATKQDTVIGYYDWLPSLTGASACTIGSAAIPEGDRTFTYYHRDGSGSVRIEIKPADGSHFLATGAEGEDLTSPRTLNETAFEKIADQTSGGTIGGDGEYVLTNSWITANLDGDQDYIITFFDLENGVEKKGYEGYDKWKAYVTSTGDKNVVAVVADANKGQNHTVQVTNGTASSGTPGETSNADTVNGVVTIHANPAGGYKFTGWETIVGNGRFLEDGGKNKEVTTFRPTSLDATVRASFAAADFTPTEGHAKVYYGDNEFYNENDGDLVQVGTKDPEVSTMEYGYALLNTEEVKDHLGVETLPVNVYTADGVGDGTNITNKKPDWLLFDEDTGAFEVDRNEMAKGVHVRKDANGDDVPDELKVYVKITSNGGLSKIVPFTVDIMTADLEIEDPISAADYFTAYVDAKRKDVIDHGDPIELDYFTYTSVRSVQNNADKVDNGPNAGEGTEGAPIDHDGSKWTVSSLTFNGTGPDPALTENANDYTFTFTYKPDTDEVTSAEKWDYNPAKVTLKITVQKPPQSIQFADTITNYAEVTVGRGDDYSAIEKDEVPARAPEAMAYATNTWRQNETITYLDTEPLYKVKFQAIGTIHGAKWTIVDDKMEGFEVAEGSNMPTYDDTKIKDVAPSFVLKLAPKSEDIPEGYEGDLWTGVHHVKFIVSGFVDEGKTVPITPATYELTVKVLPRTITDLNVTVTDGEPKPDEVTPTLDGGKTLKPDGTDDKGNDPIKKTTVTWGPQTDSKNTQVEVKVEIDPNYIYTKGDPEDPDDTPDITETTKMKVTGHLTPPPKVERVEEDEDHIVHITQPIPYLMHDDVKVGSDSITGPAMRDTRPTVRVQQGGKLEDSYQINLGAYGADVVDVEWKVVNEENSIFDIGAVLKDLEGNVLAGKDYVGNFETLTLGGDNKVSLVLDLSGVDTSKTSTYNFTLNACGKANTTDEDRAIESSYVFRLNIFANNPPSPPDPCPCKVFYHIGSHGVTSDPTVEDVKESSRPSKVPAVAPVDGYIFRGWSLTNPATLKDGEQPVLVDPKTVTAKGETMIFYAVIQKTPYHEHYIIGYPNGNFAPGADINRAAVATIIARAILPDFVEGADYGNPGGYSDVSGHWAESAIAYCSKFGVFEGLPDGTFQPNRSITRQEFALVIARLDGVMNAGEMDFTDIGNAGTWALGGIYTAYVKGWVNGYPDGSFKPLNNISRAEAVKVFNAYLKRGVDADGLRDLHEYVYPDKNTGNDFDQYRTWPDVPATYWAYYDIIEASNDHAYEANMDGTYSVPEKWTECWINERWGGKTVSADAAMVSAGFQVWLH